MGCHISTSPTAYGGDPAPTNGVKKRRVKRVCALCQCGSPNGRATSFCGHVQCPHCSVSSVTVSPRPSDRLAPTPMPHAQRFCFNSMLLLHAKPSSGLHLRVTNHPQGSSRKQPSFIRSQFGLLCVGCAGRSIAQLNTASGVGEGDSGLPGEPTFQMARSCG